MSTGLFTLRQRDYNPNLGRFISEDPIRLESGETNFYQYAFNAPTYYVDPDGESPISKAAIIAVKKAKQRFLRKLIKDRITSRLKKLLTKKGFKQAAKRYVKFPRNNGRSKKSVNYSEEEQHEQAAVEFKI
ncbi:RHS repeat domain-containing protein [Gimesia chilikensis]|uniref:RHS repeat-associated core domain-containing protein n=1 Tax=Gimesia chilikensis TaxID=2605989 RepID=A0A517PL90_9PLAN|nr:hypothetical protein HG66A1_19300 [Gimesia chilikensis]